MLKCLLDLIGGAAIVRLLRPNKKKARPKNNSILAATGDAHYWGSVQSPRPSRLAASLAAYQEDER